MEKKCVFCKRANFEERIIGENDSAFIVATLGQISNSGYLLLIPKRHAACIGAMEKSEIGPLETMKNKINLVLRKEYKIASTIMFEHGIVGQTIQHAHVHFIPEICDITKKVSKDFPSNEYAFISSFLELQKLYSIRKLPYLLWKDSSIGIRVYWNPPAPAQYLRIVVAEALGRPERADWKTMDSALDKCLEVETITRLKKYF